MKIHGPFGDSDKSLDRALVDRLVSHGKYLLEAFHDEYDRNPIGTATEFRRGHVAEWRHILSLVYGESAAEALILRSRNAAKRSVPHAGLLSDDGESYIGWDSGCDGGSEGKVE